MTNYLSGAAMWPDRDAFPVHDAAHDAFMTLSHYTSIRKRDGQPVVAGAMRHLKAGASCRLFCGFAELQLSCMMLRNLSDIMNALAVHVCPF